MVFEKILGCLLVTVIGMNKLLQNNIVALCILLFIISSCSSLKIVPIELPKKGKNELPGDIQSLVLVNRTLDERYSDLKTDSLQKIFYEKNFNTDTVIFDIAAIDTTLKALGELLFESGRYDFVIPENRFLDFEKNAFFSNKMSWEEARVLCETYNTDAVLSIDLFGTRVITQFDKDSYFDSGQNAFINVSEAQMVVIYQSLFRVYDPEKEIVLIQETFTDTLVWENMALTTRELFRNFTPVKQALTEAGIALAIDFSEKISTTWIAQNRGFYVKGDKELSEAGTFIDAGEWQKAMELWQYLANNSGKKSTKSKAEFNLAVAYEIQGDIDKAIEWGLKSYNTMYRSLTYQYLELLESRKKTLEKENK